MKVQVMVELRAFFMLIQGFLFFAMTTNKKHPKSVRRQYMAKLKQAVLYLKMNSFTRIFRGFLRQANVATS